MKATQNIIEACLEHKVKRLIHVSSPSIYVTYQDKFNIKESDPLPTHQTCYYSQTKLVTFYFFPDKWLINYILSS